MAVMEGTELALERMSLDKGGRGGLIVNTASLAGIGRQIPVILSSLFSYERTVWTHSQHSLASWHRQADTSHS